ncbi:hypothetical protein [Gluconacetobacter entanii]|uniref:Uncharacterized protein n=1 Tax=Gluconacetobacter entanii TaxID=108528 RepID=A0A318PYC5_9PROT|nr:hypothetical protein [Gluconacetobacter entanii]MCE2577390.1 hypothetical protein [Komagataeibacter sp. FNDCR1]PYD63482.1 hypothetical protein CFR72_07050 [Gluconacetobacter entanii]
MMDMRGGFLARGFMALCGVAALVGPMSPVAVWAQPAAGGWTPKGCGAAPVAPKVDSADVSRFNASVDRVNAYEKAARTYATCVAAASTKEQAAISADASARMHRVHESAAQVQKQVSDQFARLSAEMKKGHDHLAAR